MNQPSNNDPNTSNFYNDQTEAHPVYHPPNPVPATLILSVIAASALSFSTTTAFPTVSAAPWLVHSTATSAATGTLDPLPLSLEKRAVGDWLRLSPACLPRV